MNTPQEMANLITELVKKKGVSVNKMLLECGAGKSLLDNMKRGQEPSATKLMLVANYLDVTLDYLMTGKEANLKKEISTEDFLAQQGITNEEHIKSIKNIFDLMKKDDYNTELGDEFISKEYNKN